MISEGTYWLLRILTTTGPEHVGSNAATWLKAFDAAIVDGAIKAGLLRKYRLVITVTDAGTLWLARREAIMADPAKAELERVATHAVTAIRALLETGDDGDELNEALLSRAFFLASEAMASPIWDTAEDVVGAQRRSAIARLNDLANDDRTAQTSEDGVTAPRSRVDALKAAAAAIPEWEGRGR